MMTASTEAPGRASWYMSPRRSEQLRRLARSRLTRATASISRERSMPTACSTRGAKSRACARFRCRYRAVRAPRPAAAHRAARPGPRARRHKASGCSPLRGVGAGIRGGGFGAGALDLLQPLDIELDDRVAVRHQPGEQPRQRAPFGPPRQAIEDRASLAQAVEQPGLAQQLQMTRDARLALSENLRHLAHRQLGAGAEHENPQPSRLGDRTQRCKHALQCRPLLQ